MESLEYKFLTLKLEPLYLSNLNVLKEFRTELNHILVYGIDLSTIMYDVEYRKGNYGARGISLKTFMWQQRGFVPAKSSIEPNLRQFRKLLFWFPIGH